MQKQIVAADAVIINKSLLASIENMEDIKDFIKSINPDTSIILSKDGSFDRMNLVTENNQKTLTPTTIYKSESVHKIKTMLYETDAFFDIQKLKYELFRNLYLYYHHIYRIKGYVLNAEKEFFLVQTTGKTVVITQSKNQQISKSQLVFIGKELELKSIERILKGAIAKNKKLQLI